MRLRYFTIALCVLMALPVISIAPHPGTGTLSVTSFNGSRGLAWNTSAVPCIDYSPVGSPSNYPYAITVPQMNSIYNVTPLHNKGFLGQGETIAIIDAYGDPYLNYDISSFDSFNNLTSPNINIVYPFGATKNYNLSWAVETATDVEWVHAIAPLATIDLVLTPSAEVGYLQAAVNYTVQNMTVNSISMSWGSPESALPKALTLEYSQIFNQAQSLGISVFAASGDQGAYDGTGSLTVNFPASSPMVTAVGGTSIYFINGKLYQYAWDGSGGGYSSYFSASPIQNASGFNGTRRGVPDISFDANPNSGGVFVFAGAALYAIGGTSLATPIAAGIFMVISQYLGRNLGYIDPYLYEIAKTNQYGNAIIPVPIGNNGKYSASYNWNPVTGLGTINAFQFAKAIEGYTGTYGISLNFNRILNSSFNFSATLKYNSFVTGNSTYTYRAGIGIYSGGSEILSDGIMQQGGNFYYYFKIGSTIKTYLLKFSDINYNVSLNFNCSEIYMEVGNQYYNESVFPSDIYGGMLDAKITTAEGSLPSNFSSVQISNVSFRSGSTSLKSESSQSYSSYLPFNDSSLNVFGVSSSGNAYTISSGDSNLNNLNMVYGPSTEYFKISQAYPVSIIFSSQATSIYVNGSLYQKSSMILSSGTYYNITESYLGTTANFYIRTPVYSKSTLLFNYSANYYDAKFNLTLDGLSHMIVDNGTNISAIGDSNMLSGSSLGFYNFYSNTRIRSLVNISVLERPVNISFTVFPSSSSLSFNGKNVPLNETLNIIPKSYNYTLSSAGFNTQTSALKLEPGINMTIGPQELAGTDNGFFLSGNVYNEYFISLDNINVPVSGVNVSYNSTDYSLTTLSGFYSIWLPSGTSRIHLTNPYFDNYSTNVTLSGNLSGYDMEIYPSLKPLNGNSPAVYITKVMPLLFFTSYISWSTNIVSQISYYILDYRDGPNSSWNQIMIKSPTQSYTFLNGIYPGKNYYIKISAVLRSNTVINSSVVQLSYSNPIYSILSGLIYAGIILYAYIVVSAVRRRRARKRAQKEFKDLP